MVLLGSLGLGCGPADPPTPRVWTVSPRTLWESHVDGDSRWTGQTVRVTIAAGNYSVAPNCVRWHPDRPDERASLVFYTDAPPADARRPIEIVGTVTGRVVDGFDRGFGVNWYVRVDRCSVTLR